MSREGTKSRKRVDRIEVKTVDGPRLAGQPYSSEQEDYASANVATPAQSGDASGRQRTPQGGGK
jgi:hypothetical protein